MYAGQCLEGNAWNLEAARANYENVRVSFAALSLRLRPLILRLFSSYSKPFPRMPFLLGLEGRSGERSGSSQLGRPVGV